MRATTTRRYTAALVALTALVAAASTTASADPGAVQPARPPLPVPAAQAGAVAVDQVSTASGWAQHPLWIKVDEWKTKTSPRLTADAPRGYSPGQLRQYLHLRGDGAGQTVAIVDAYDNPYLVQDVTAYSTQFGLPAPCATAADTRCFHLSVQHPFGFAGVDPGWALEEDLDVQMVHALVPQASITMVEGYDASLIGLVEAIDYAASAEPDAISLSWGADEFPGEDAADGHCALAQTLCVASTGDRGNPPSYPSTSPNVLAVGGTTMVLGSGGKVTMEAAWCCGSSNGPAGTGGGVSAYEPRPTYQQDVGAYPRRSVPDVTFDADPATGVAVYDTFGIDGQNGWFQVGGTSAGAPAWAAIAAEVDQLRATAHKARLAGADFQAHSLLYREAPAGFSDITLGTDAVSGCAGRIDLCLASSGFDAVSGWGSPRSGIDADLAGAS